MIRLRAFEARPVGAGTDHGLTLGAQLVGQAVDDLLIGANDEEIGVEFGRGGRHALDAVGGDARVAGSHDDVRALGQSPRQGVLARARADDDTAPHEGRTNCSRPGPTPTTEMVTPVVCSRNVTYCLAASGKVRVLRRRGDVRVPTGQDFVHGCHLVQYRLVIRRIVVANAVRLVGDADL